MNILNDTVNSSCMKVIHTHNRLYVIINRAIAWLRVGPKKSYFFMEKWQLKKSSWGFEFQAILSTNDLQTKPAQTFSIYNYVFQFWPMRELETITQPFLFFRCTCISLVQSHGSNGPNDGENVPTYVSRNIIGNYVIIVPNDAKITKQKNEIIKEFWSKDFQIIHMFKENPYLI